MIREELRRAQIANPNITQDELEAIRERIRLIMQLAQISQQQQVDQREVEARERIREATREQIQDLDFQIIQQRRINSGLSDEAMIREELRRAQIANPNITQDELEAIRETY